MRMSLIFSVSLSSISSSSFSIPFYFVCYPLDSFFLFPPVFLTGYSSLSSERLLHFFSSSLKTLE